MITFVCPKCRAPLVRAETALSCAACEATYAVVDGVPDLLGAMTVEAEDHPETDYYSAMHRRPDPLSDLVADNLFAAVRAAVERCAEAAGRRLDIVDIGSGNLLRPPRQAAAATTGRLFAIIRDHARSYIGLEPSWAMIRDVPLDEGRVAHLPFASLVRTTGEDLPLAAASADVVLCLSVLDHCVDPPLVLRRAREALRPGGVLVLTLQNHDRWYRKVLRAVSPGVDERHEANDHHHHRFTPGAARDLLASAGFRDTTVREFGYLLVPKVRELVGAPLRPFERHARTDAARGVAMIDRSLSRMLPGLGQSFLLAASI